MTKKEASLLGNAKMREVVAAQKTKRIANYNAHPDLCKKCGEPLSYDKHLQHGVFCSRACAATYNNAHRVQSLETRLKISESLTSRTSQPSHERLRNPHSRVKVYKKCDYCGGDVHSAHSDFCSRECASASRWEERCTEIESTGEYPPEGMHGETNRRVARRYMEEHTGHVCSICGATDWMDAPIPLTVDHIDGDATNHRVDNLRLVCPNCDAQLSTFKNTGDHCSSRIWRRKGYDILNDPRFEWDETPPRNDGFTCHLLESV